MRQSQLWGKFENHLLNEGVTKQRVNKLSAMFSIAERGLVKNFEEFMRKKKNLLSLMMLNLPQNGKNLLYQIIKSINLLKFKHLIKFKLVLLIEEINKLEVI